MNCPRISVVTPSYNQARYLEQTIRSVLDQDYPNLEYIVIDGGSSDSSVKILERYSSRLDFWCSERDDGQADAIAKGFGRATGEILCWLNSDDLLLPSALRVVARYFERHPKTEAVSGGAYVIDAQGNPNAATYGSYTMGVPSTYNRFRYFGQEGIFQQATFWRRSAYDAVGGIDTTLKFAMDLDLFTRLARRRRFGQLPRMLACFRLHEECKSMQWQVVREAELSLLEAKYLHGEERAAVRSFRKWIYRNMNRTRKTMLAGARQAGLVALPKKPFPGELAC